MVTLAPLAIVLGASAAVGLLFYGFWDRVSRRLQFLTKFFEADLERAGMHLASEQIIIGIFGISVSVWIFTIMLARPSPIVAVAYLGMIFAIATVGFRSWVKGKAKKRAAVFTEQLEMVLRLISNALRVGLGMRQAIVMVTDELEDPVRGEFLRVFAQTNIGVPLPDALDALVRRIPSEELRMMVDAIRVQSQTGGNLAKILDHLAMTIKGRRAVRRKIKALTSEASAGAWVLGAIPLLVGCGVMLINPSMRDDMLSTPAGHFGLGLFVGLETIGIFILVRLLSFEI